MASLAYPLSTVSPFLRASILGTTPTAAQLAQIIAFEQQGEDSDSKRYLAIYIPLLVLPHPKSGIPCSASLSTGSLIGRTVQQAASIPSPASPFLAIGGGLVSELSGIFGGPSGEQKAEAPILCTGYLQVNAAFQQLDEQLQLGQLTLAQYQAELQILQQRFNNLIAPVNQPNSAADRYARMVDAFVRLRIQIAPQVVGIGDNVSYLSRGVTSTPTGMAAGPTTPGFLASATSGGGISFSPGLVAILVIALLLLFGLGAV
jgi:hypothetical protein